MLKGFTAGFRENVDLSRHKKYTCQDYWCGCLDHIHKMYMVAVTLPSYPAFRPMFVINILIYKIPKQFSEICGNLRHYLQIVFILVLIKHICLAAICKWCFCVKKVFLFFFTNHGVPALLTM